MTVKNHLAAMLENFAMVSTVLALASVCCACKSAFEPELIPATQYEKDWYEMDKVKISLYAILAQAQMFHDFMGRYPQYKEMPQMLPHCILRDDGLEIFAYGKLMPLRYRIVGDEYLKIVFPGKDNVYGTKDDITGTVTNEKISVFGITSGSYSSGRHLCF